MPFRFASVAASAALGFALYGAAPAFADPLPIIGTAACTAAVAADNAVTTATKALDNARTADDAAGKALADAQTAADAASLALSKLPADDPEFAAAGALVTSTGTARDRAVEAKAVTAGALEDATAGQATAIDNATAARCMEAPVVTPTTTAPVPTSTTPAPVDATEATITRIRALIAAIECGPEFNARNGAVQDATFDALPSLSAEQQGELADEYNARLRAINFCADAGSTTPTTTPPVTVDPLADDGSTANVSGNQVTVVPQGSVSTGAL